MLMPIVAYSIFGSQRGLLGSTEEKRGAQKWYGLIDRGARDSVCERNSKKSPRDVEGVHGGRKGARAKEGGVWWSGGTEPENCIACSVISLPPGSHSLSLPSFHSPLTPQVFPTSCSFSLCLCLATFAPSRLLPLSLSVTTSHCHFSLFSPPLACSPPLSWRLSPLPLLSISVSPPSPPPLPSCVLTWLWPPFLCYHQGLKNA